MAEKAARARVEVTWGPSYIKDRDFKSFASNMIKSVNETKWSSLASQDQRSYSLYFD